MKKVCIFFDDEDLSDDPIWKVAAELYELVIQVYNFEEFEANFEKYSKEWIVVFLDHKFSNSNSMNSASLLRQIRALNQNIPVVLHTADPSSLAANQSLELIETYIYGSIKKRNYKQFKLVSERLKSTSYIQLYEYIESYLISLAHQYKDKPIWISVEDNKKVTAHEVLVSLRNNGNLGLDFAKMVIGLAVENIRSK